MILSFILILIFFFQFYGGSRRGFIYTLLDAIALTISFILASRFSQPLTYYLNLWVPYPAVNMSSNFALYTGPEVVNLDQSFYEALAFLIMFLVLWLIYRLIVRFLKIDPLMEVYPLWNRMGGGLVNLIIAYVICFFFLFILSTLPVENLQEMIANSSLTQLILKHSPFLSQFAQTRWLSFI